ncbi:AAA-like domain-containing protein [Allocoleopsis sp.]|uniref:AAA-like domain-containing protein n=1 Tax=Allocoleopsis sp. TaxID=3088169 RepID=UPI002FD1336D
MYTQIRGVDEYQVGGSLPLEAPTYVIRQADADLYRGVKAGQFCYVLNSRQMGKSSLRVRTMQRLQAEGMSCAAVDLTAIGNQNITSEQWYAGIIYTLASSFNLLDHFDIETWWGDSLQDSSDGLDAAAVTYEFLSPVQRLSKFIDQVLLRRIPDNIAIFVDEIDSILTLNFSIDDFFALIQSCYNQRAEQPEYNRLTWILLGVATPSDLIRSTNYTTPFNGGCAIELTGFQLHEVQPLAQGLVGRVPNSNAVIREILNWTGGQPFLTQKLCKLVLQELGVNGGIPADNLSMLVESRLIENWEAQDEPEHLRTIRDRLCRCAPRDRILKSGQRTVRRLGLYQQILRQGQVLANDSPEQVELRLSGLVVKQDSQLKVYNRIYQSIFNLAWVEDTLANLQSR